MEIIEKSVYSMHGFRSKEYKERALLVAAKTSLEQAKRIEQAHGELDGRMWESWKTGPNKENEIEKDY